MDLVVHLVFEFLFFLDHQRIHELFQQHHLLRVIRARGYCFPLSLSFVLALIVAQLVFVMTAQTDRLVMNVFIPPFLFPLFDQYFLLSQIALDYLARLV